jgi:uncharacterized protein YbjT (DUF2867 family)
MKPISVLVTGATGRQGGQVARHLLRKGHRVRALTRNPQASSATYLERIGAEVVQGDFAHPESVERAAKGLDAAFIVTTPFEGGAEAEERMGIAALDAVDAAGVGHIVFSSVAGASTCTGIPHFDSKHRIEAHLGTLSTPSTVVAPVFFMENLLGPAFLPGLRTGSLAMPLPRWRRLQQVALTDLGAFCALVLERRDPFLSQRIEVASDELTGEEAARALSLASGRDIHFVELPLAVVRAESEDMARMYEWFDRVGYHADIDRLRLAYPEVGWHSFDDWLRGQDLNVIGAPADWAAAVTQESDLR